MKHRDPHKTRRAVHEAYSKAEILRTMRNARTQHQAVVVAEVAAKK